MAMREGTRLAKLVTHPNPHWKLNKLYSLICRYLQKYPEDSNYRKNTQIIIEFRKSVLQETQCVEEIENLIGCGRIEQLIVQAERELYLAKKLIDYKPWEPLVSEPPENQWKWPVIKN